jgi:ATP adenylyltransferase
MKVYEPSRLAYRKKIGTVKKCQFCDLLNIKSQICESLSGKYWRVVANKYPYMDGNLMIVPKRHFRDIEDMNKEERNEFFEIIVKTKKKLSKIFKTNDFNIGLNLGKKAGASIEHLHWQIIPRKDKIINASNIFADLYVITVSPQKLKKIIDSA